MSEKYDYELIGAVGGGVAIAVLVSIFGLVKVGVIGGDTAAEQSTAAATAPTMRRLPPNLRPVRAKEVAPRQDMVPTPRPLAPGVDLPSDSDAPVQPRPTALPARPVPEPPQPRGLAVPTARPTAAAPTVTAPRAPTAAPTPAAPKPPPAATPAPAPKPPAPPAAAPVAPPTPKPATPAAPPRPTPVAPTAPPATP